MTELTSPQSMASASRSRKSGMWSRIASSGWLYALGNCRTSASHSEEDWFLWSRTNWARVFTLAQPLDEG